MTDTRWLNGPPVQDAHAVAVERLIDIIARLIGDDRHRICDAPKYLAELRDLEILVGKRERAPRGKNVTPHPTQP